MMPQSLSNILVHIVFSTKKRQQWLSNEIRHELYPYVTTILRNNNCKPYEIGGIADHMHILCSLSKTITTSNLIETVKTATSKLVKTKNSECKNFYWQRGYGAFSISPKHIDVVRCYITSQDEHHKKFTFEDELRKLLHKYRIEYDDKYLWD